MTSDDYVKNAIRTESVLEAGKIYNATTLRAALIVAIQASNLVDQVKKNLYYGKAINAQSLAEQTSALLTNTQRLNLSLQNLTDGESLPITDDARLLRVLHAGLGIFTEGGEILEAVEKALDGQALDLVNVGEEGGDVDWYKAILQDATGTHENDIRERNIAKLRARYPERFDAHQAIHRDLITERAILEGSPEISSQPPKSAE